MAELNEDAFAAVDQFLGDHADKLPIEKESALRQLATVSSKNRRAGLGAFSQPKEHHLHDIDKRVLQVGTRKRKHYDKESDSEAENNSSDDEEIQGRTAIDQVGTREERQLSASLLAKTQIPHQAKKQKHSKKGKKQREEEKTRQFTQEESEEPVLDPQIDSKSQSKSEKQKRKRPKIRSKQKNIYKDKREKKPEHLIPGSKNYQGRPLTSETRSKLHLPSSKASTSNYEPLKSHWNGKTSDTVDSSTLDIHRNSSVSRENKKMSPKRYKNLTV